MDEYSDRDKENGTKKDFKGERSKGWRIIVRVREYICGSRKEFQREMSMVYNAERGQDSNH